MILSEEEAGVPVAAAAPTERDHVMGSPDAPLVLVEYGEYECITCRIARVAVGHLQQKFGERLAYVFRHFPQSRQHPHAQLAAEAAEAAGAQGKFWEMHARLFETGQLSEDDLRWHAEEIGLDVERFRRELRERTYAPRVVEDLEEGIRVNVTRTPTFFINSQRYEGPLEVKPLKEALEAAL
ncbi:MAG: thioredoxin domain-containing protein [Gemmatimonadetes bacterium]|nr:thioredoxin domain-containing protein [Gemmatimonadota bacterium]